MCKLLQDLFQDRDENIEVQLSDFHTAQCCLAQDLGVIGLKLGMTLRSQGKVYQENYSVMDSHNNTRALDDNHIL